MSVLGRLLGGASIALALVLYAWPGLGDGDVDRARHGLERAGSVARALWTHPEGVASPGPLAPAHAAQEELADCGACHGLTRGVAREACLECHDEVAARLEQASGYHGRFLTGDCAECHADHRPSIVELDRRAFNHELALYALRGEHLAVECDACHRPDAAAGEPTRARWIGLAFGACSDCHADPHADQFGASSCKTCHDESGFAGEHLTFAHDGLASFPLSGAHRNLACEACHEPPVGEALAAARFRGLERSCEACHEDPHAAREPRRPDAEARACDACHATASWSVPGFDHGGLTAFPLDGAHAALACNACHAEAPTFRPTPTTCESCHELQSEALAGRLRLPSGAVTVAPDPHAGLVSCSECHDLSTPRPSPSAQARLCADCHSPRYAGLHLDRSRWRLETEAARLATRDPGTRAELDALLGIGSHHFEEAHARAAAALSRAR